jgi:hypothetical protein
VFFVCPKRLRCTQFALSLRICIVFRLPQPVSDVSDSLISHGLPEMLPGGRFQLKKCSRMALRVQGGVLWGTFKSYACRVKYSPIRTFTADLYCFSVASGVSNIHNSHFHCGSVLFFVCLKRFRCIQFAVSLRICNVFRLPQVCQMHIIRTFTADL